MFRRPPEDHVLRRFAQQPGKQQHHNRHLQPVFRHERLGKYIVIVRVSIWHAVVVSLVFDFSRHTQPKHTQHKK